MVDNDILVRQLMEGLIWTAGWAAETFSSAEAFLSRPRATVPCCLVLDITLPGLNGLELQTRIADRTDMPIVFVTGNREVPVTVQAMKAGAVDFLMKPVKGDAVLAAIGGAIERSRAALRRESGLRELRSRYTSLTPREREVMAWSCPAC